MYLVPSILPSLYDWGFWVPFFFRLFLAWQLYREARRLMGGNTSELLVAGTSAPTPSAQKTLAWIMMILSFMFFVGLGLQIVAVFVACAYFIRYVQLMKNPNTSDTVRHLVLLSTLVSFSLLFLGPGPYAIDLPL